MHKTETAERRKSAAFESTPEENHGVIWPAFSNWEPAEAVQSHLNI